MSTSGSPDELDDGALDRLGEAVGLTAGKGPVDEVIAATEGKAAVAGALEDKKNKE